MEPYYENHFIWGKAKVFHVSKQGILQKKIEGKGKFEKLFVAIVKNYVVCYKIAKKDIVPSDNEKPVSYLKISSLDSEEIQVAEKYLDTSKLIPKETSCKTTFQIPNPTGTERLWYIKCTSDEEVQEWIKAIQEQMDSVQKLMQDFTENDSLDKIKGVLPTGISLDDSGDVVKAKNWLATMSVYAESYQKNFDKMKLRSIGFVDDKANDTYIEWFLGALKTELRENSEDVLDQWRKHIQNVDVIVETIDGISAGKTTTDKAKQMVAVIQTKVNLIYYYNYFTFTAREFNGLFKAEEYFLEELTALRNYAADLSAEVGVPQGYEETNERLERKISATVQDEQKKSDLEEVEKTKYTATHNYNKSSTYDMNFNKNDIVWVIEENEDGWWTAEINNKLGYVPGSFLKKIELE